METYFFDEYQRSFTEKDVLKKMHMPEDHAFGQSIASLLERTDEIAKPKSVMLKCHVDEITSQTVTIEGYTFHSSILGKKLKGNEYVYPYINTCGQELADYAKTLTDMVEQFAFDAVMEFYLRQISAVSSGAADEFMAEGRSLSSSSPGSLIDWHIREQRILFDLIGENVERVGVELNDSFLMFPVKSTSGIRFGSEGVLHDCALCQKKNCPSRKVPFSMEAFLSAKDEDDM